MKTLSDIWYDLACKGFETDKGSVHGYLPFYEEYLEPYRHAALKVLEIGLFKGNSLRMWEQYFTNAEVIGIDCDELPHGGLGDLRPIMAELGHNIFIMDALDEEQVSKAFRNKLFDVVIEDAGHHLEQQIDLYKMYKPYLRKGAIYIIEDIQDIDATRDQFENIDHDKKITIIDNRKVRPRYDDVLCIIQDKL